MKIKPEHLAHMKAAILANAHAPTLPSYLARGLTEKRWRWDLLYAAGLSRWICDNIYSYANDEHIDTALRSITRDPTLSNEATRDDVRPGYHDTAAQTEYTVHGFNLITTGGNCTALHKPLNSDGSRYVLVTVPDDAEAPTERGELVRVGLYGPDHSEELDTFMASSAEEVSAVIKAKEWK